MGREVRSCKGLGELNRWRRSFKSGSFVHPQKWRAVHILPCNFTLQNKTHKSNVFFDDYSVKGINNDPKPHSAFLETALPLFPLQKKKALLSSTPWFWLGPSCHTPQQGSHRPSWMSGFCSPFKHDLSFPLFWETWGLMCCRGELGATLIPHMVTKLQRFLCQKRLCVTSSSGLSFST